jgi:hypothetical protein
MESNVFQRLTILCQKIPHGRTTVKKILIVVLCGAQFVPLSRNPGNNLSRGASFSLLPKGGRTSPDFSPR